MASESAAQNHDPAPADLDEEYRKMLLVYEAGKQAKAAGEKWGERIFNGPEITIAFCLGWLGQPLED